MDGSTQKKFISHHWLLTLDQLKRERLIYRDSKSIEARILNVLIKAKVNPHYINEILQDSNSQPFNYQVIKILQNELELSQKIKDFNETPYLQILSDANLMAEKTHSSLSQKRKDLEQKLHTKAELNPALAEGVEQQGEFIRTLGDLAKESDKIRHVANITASSAESLSLGGLIGSIVANALGLIINSYVCLKERRMPNNFEKAKISYSAVILSLTLLSFAGIGGPLGISILSTVATFVILSKTITEIIRDQFRLRSARTATAHYAEQRSKLLTEIKTLTEACFTLKQSELLNQPNAQRQEFQAKLAQLNLKTQELATNQKYWSHQVLKMQLLEERQTNKFLKIRKFGLLLGGSISLIGAAFSLTPLLPIGIMLIVSGTFVSLIAELSYRFSNFLHQRQQQKFTDFSQNNLVNISNLSYTPKEDTEVSLTQQLATEINPSSIDTFGISPDQPQSSSDESKATDHKKMNTAKEETEEEEEDDEGPKLG